MTFTEKPILVIGDVILDAYLEGTATRISPEAPVPVIALKTPVPRYSLGGAANVAANIKSLGGNPILIGVLGTDVNAQHVCRLLVNKQIINRSIYYHERPTTCKTRVIANGQQIVRFDVEDTSPLSEEHYELLTELIRKHSQDAAGIVVSDYAKGVVDAEVMECVHSRLVDMPVVVDPKVANKHLYTYWPASFAERYTLTPNMHEAAGLVGQQLWDLQADTNVRLGMLSQLHNANVLLTMGEQGMVLCEHGNKQPMHTRAAKPLAVFDVCGAGDTVVATFALAQASGIDKLTSMHLANHAAGIAVSRHGTTTVTLAELMESAGSGKLAMERTEQ